MLDGRTYTAALEASAITQRELADRTGIDQSLLSKYKSYGTIPEAHARKILHALTAELEARARAVATARVRVSMIAA